MKHLIVIFLTLILVSLIFPKHKLSAAFNPGLIITDQQLFTPTTMTAEEIQSFLNRHNGTLKNYFTTDIDGLLKTAAMIIFDASQRHQINPQYLLALLQKEQGLITDDKPWPSQIDWAMGYALCDQCDADHPIVVKYKGFAKQIDSAAWRTRYYKNNIDLFKYKPGQSYEIDGENVFVSNMATAALLNYTPHLHGNKILQRLWLSWFQDIEYPTNTLLQAIGEPGVWLIKDGLRHPFTSKTALTSRFNANLIIQVPKIIIEEYPIGTAITYPEFALLRTPNQKVYLLIDNELRLITDDETMKQLGFMEDEIEATNEKDLAFYKYGSPITIETLEPLGSLIQDPNTYGIYFVKDGYKYPLIAPELIALNFSHLKVRKTTEELLDRYQKAEPIKLKDGLLIKSSSSPEVYVIANGLRLPIDSEYTFNTLGYSWNKIHIISDRLLALHQIGETVAVEKPLSDKEATDIVTQDASPAGQLIE